LVGGKLEAVDEVVYPEGEVGIVLDWCDLGLFRILHMGLEMDACGAPEVRDMPTALLTAGQTEMMHNA